MAVLGGSFVLAALVGGWLQFKAPASWRSWAAPAAAVIAVLGVEYALHLPDWISIPLYLAIPFLYHRKMRNMQLAAAEALDSVPIKADEALRRVPSPGGRCLAIWTNAPEEVGQATKVVEPLTFALEFEGEHEDSFTVSLRAECGKARPGMLFAHHSDAKVDLPPALKHCEAIGGLPGQTPDVVLRALPDEYAFDIFDIATVSALSELLALRRDRREVVLHISGPKLKIEADGLFDVSELDLIIRRAAQIFMRVRGGGTSGFSEPEAPKEPGW